MAYIDESGITDNVVQHITTKQEFFDLAKSVLWAEFIKHKNDSYKGTTFGIPWSIKVAKAEPLLVKFLGPNPYA